MFVKQILKKHTQSKMKKIVADLRFYAKFGIKEELVAPHLLPIYRLSDISLRIRLSDLGATPR